MRLLTMNGAVLNRPAALGPGGIATDNVKLWLKADALGLSNGTAISSFTDSGPLGNHAVQATGTKQPIYTTGGQNGMPYGQWDATDDLMRVATPSLTDTAVLTVFSVFSAPSGSSRMIYEMTDGDAGNTAGTIQGLRRTDDAMRMQIRGNGGVNTPQLVDVDHSYTTTPRYLTTVYDFTAAAGAEVSGRYNGTAIVGVYVNSGTENTDTAFAAQPLNLGDRNTGGFASNMRLYEFIILKGKDTTERTTVEAYLASKYGL